MELETGTVILSETVDVLVYEGGEFDSDGLLHGRTAELGEDTFQHPLLGQGVDRSDELADEEGRLIFIEDEETVIDVGIAYDLFDQWIDID